MSETSLQQPPIRIKRVRLEVRVGRYPHWEYVDVLQVATRPNESTGDLSVVWVDVPQVYVDRVDGVETPITEAEYRSGNPPAVVSPTPQMTLGFPA